MHVRISLVQKFIYLLSRVTIALFLLMAKPELARHLPWKVNSEILRSAICTAMPVLFLGRWNMSSSTLRKMILNTRYGP